MKPSRQTHSPAPPVMNISSDYLIIEPRANTPFMNYDPKKNVIFIKGNSFNEKVIPLYSRIMNLISGHYETHESLTLYLYLNKINTLTVKALFDIFRLLKKEQKNGKRVKITWFFDQSDNSMMDNAHDFSDLFDMKFSIVPV